MDAPSHTTSTSGHHPPHTRKGSMLDAATLPWFLKPDCDDDEIVYDDGPPQTVRAGTLPALVEHLTRHDRLDVSFNETFLTTYPTFATAPELLDALLARFYMHTPPQLRPAELALWTAQKQQPVRLRVVNVLKTWLERFWMEPRDESSQDLLRHLRAQVQSSAAIMDIPTAAQLLAVIGLRLQGQEILRRLASPSNTAVPKPITPKNLKKLKLLDIDATELARQLTIIESRIYARIQPRECLSKAWGKTNTAPTHTPTAVNAMILHSNRLANWVGQLVLGHDEMKKRVSTIKHFVTVAEECRDLHNYATMMSIISGLGTSPVYRLHRTWSQVSPRIRATLQELRSLMASERNFARYRETLRRASPPGVPFLGIYLTDLTFIEDGIPDLVQPGLINFSKRAKTAEILHSMQRYQNMPYSLQPVAEIQEFVTRGMQAAGDVNEMYERSLRLEPRQMHEERVVRGGSYPATGSHMSSVVIASMVLR